MEAEVQVEEQEVVQEEDQQGRKMSEIQIRLLLVGTEKKKKEMTHTLHYYKVHYPRNHL
jgi:hypothetical protein